MSTTEDKGLLRSSAVVAAGTGLSRASGLLRVAALTYALGRTTLADYYNLANIAPNLVYELLLGGVLSATLVPLFVDARDKRDDESTSVLFSTVLVAATVITVVALLLINAVAALFWGADDGSSASQEIETVVSLANLLLPQIFFYGLATLSTAALNSRRVFGVPAFTPVLNNVITSAMFVVAGSVIGGDSDILDVERYDSSTTLLIGLGTTAGVAAMSLGMVPSLRRALPNLRWNFQPRHSSVRRLLGLSGWTVGYVIANQIALLIIYFLATSSGEGELTAYTTAFIFFQLPHGLFAVSIMTTVLPDLSSAATEGRIADFKDQFLRGLRLMLLVVLPAAVGYLVLSQPLLAVLLERGQFGGEDTRVTANVLRALALGLPGFSVYLYTLRAYYAQKNTKTPFLINAGENALNVILALPLLFMGSVGLAIAYSIAYLLSAIYAIWRLLRGLEDEPTDLGSTVGAIVKMSVASGAMGILIWGVSSNVGSNAGGGAITRLAVCIPLGAVVYFVLATTLRVSDLEQVLERLPGPLKKVIDRLP